MHEPQPIWTEVSRTSNRRRCQEHELVLRAMGIPYGRMQVEGEQAILVPTHEAPRAREELERYERENVGWPPREEVPLAISDGIQATIVAAAVLVLVFVLDRRDAFGFEWGRAGAARSDAIQAGEWWRALTALTLHTDLSHLAGNIVFGAAFGVILAQSVGSGVAWAGFAVAGAIGNLINAMVRSPGHVSIGASTGVFGLLGIQVAFEWMRRRDLAYSTLRRWAPIAMGIALFFWLGTGGGSFSELDTPRERQKEIADVLQRVDVMAHVTGFATGLAIGAVLGFLRQRIRLRGRWQAVLGWCVLACVGAAWAVAIGAHGSER